MTTHAFDDALQLVAQGGGRYQGSTQPAWWNMVGPFGGVTAAVALQAIMLHPERLGDPISLTVNFASGLAQGTFTVSAQPVRTNRSTQHWVVTLSQDDAQGVGSVVLTATAITAVRRSTWSANDLPMPAVPPPDNLARTQPPAGTVEWLNRYDMRLISGPIPSRWDGGAASPDPALASLSRLWVRDEPARTLDFPALAAMADVFFPRIWLRRAVPVPVGTVSLTVYFHATAPQLLETGTGYLLGQARGQAFCNGYFDQAGQLWNAAGHLLATTHQLVYYKE